MAIKIVEEKKLKFKIECEYCKTVFTYEQEDLGYRLWYPHGFVYCPKCQKPLRHDPDKYAIKDENNK